MNDLFSDSCLFFDTNKDIHIPLTSITIAAGVAHRVPIHVDGSHFKLTWEFKTIAYDIVFEIVQIRSKHDSTSTHTIFSSAAYSPDVDHTGSIVIKETGDYELIWDNSHSWLREKKVEYKIDVERMEMTATEKVAYNRRLYEVLAAHNKEYEVLSSKFEECQQEKAKVVEEHSSKMFEMETIQHAICGIDESIAEKEEEIRLLHEEEKSNLSSIHYVLHSSPFLLEGERVLSFLSGVDLLKLSCVNHFLHDCISHDDVWKRAFYQEEYEQLVPVLQNDHLNTLYHLVNPEPTNHEKEVKQEEKKEIQQPQESSPVQLKDLSLLYKITEKQGWYKNKNNECYFIRFKDNSKKNFDVIFSAIPSSELDSLIRQTLKSTVLIPMPGTEAGKSGFYIDRFRRVSKWNVETVETENGSTLKWQEIQL